MIKAEYKYSVMSICVWSMVSVLLMSCGTQRHSAYFNLLQKNEESAISSVTASPDLKVMGARSYYGAVRQVVPNFYLAELISGRKSGTSACEMNRLKKFKSMGIVFNAVRPLGFRIYGYGFGSYGKGYGRAYGGSYYVNDKVSC